MVEKEIDNEGNKGTTWMFSPHRYAWRWFDVIQISLHSMRWDFDCNMLSPLLRIHCVFLVSESTGAEG